MFSDLNESEPSNQEIIHLNQVFNLFEPELTSSSIQEMFHLNTEMYRSKRTLNTRELLPNFPIEVVTIPSKGRKGSVITPFNPELGYQIDNNDFNIDARLKKHRDNKTTFDEFVDFSQASLWLQIRKAEENVLIKPVKRFSFNMEHKSREYKPEYKPILGKMRLQVFFPNLSFEAAPYLGVKDGYPELNFHRFYPLDTGPLVPKELTDFSSFMLSEGLEILVPSDKEKLAQIRGRFVFIN